MPWSLAERQAVLSGRSIPTREQKPSNGPTAKTALIRCWAILNLPPASADHEFRVHPSLSRRGTKAAGNHQTQYGAEPPNGTTAPNRLFSPVCHDGAPPATLPNKARKWMRNVLEAHTTHVPS